jgi:hypothetical protein
MRQQAGNVPTYIAVGLATLAAIMSSRPDHTDIDATVLRLLTLHAQALDMPPPDPEQPMQITSP